MASQLAAMAAISMDFIKLPPNFTKGRRLFQNTFAK
jgi:hypothetical protein